QPTLPSVLSRAYPHLTVPGDLLPATDRLGWSRLVGLRNRLTHAGPAFVDAVDLNAGRVLRHYVVPESPDHQERDVWAIGHRLCRSPFVLTCINIQGSSHEDSLLALDA